MGTASRRSPATPHRDSTLAFVGTRLAAGTVAAKLGSLSLMRLPPLSQRTRRLPQLPVLAVPFLELLRSVGSRGFM